VDSRAAAGRAAHRRRQPCRCQRFTGTARQRPQEPEYAAIGDQLPFVGGWPREEIEKLFAAHRLVNIASDPFLDLVAAEERCMEEEGLERRIRRRNAVWGDVPR
jgi:hypothetical protein